MYTAHGSRNAFSVSMVAFALLAACSRETPKATVSANASTPRASATLALPSAATGASTATALTSATAKKDGPTPITQEAQATYTKSLGEGRKATVAKDYPKAEIAFTDALKAIPGDAHALSERGYARLLAGKFAYAEDDLHAAENSTHDRKLLGAIYFNYGLVAEKQTLPEIARAAFARSNQVNPTAAAKAKLTGQGAACTAAVTSSVQPFTAATGYLGVYRILRAAAKSAGKELGTDAASEAEAKTRLCAHVPEGECEHIVSFSASAEEMMGLYEFYPIIKDAAQMYVLASEQLAETWEFPCSGELHAKVSKEGTKTVLFVSSTMSSREPVCEVKPDELAPCTDFAKVVGNACVPGTPSETTLILDEAAHTALGSVRVDQTESERVSVSYTHGSLSVTGQGCNAKLAL